MRLAAWLGGLLLLCSLGTAEAAVQVQVDGDRITLSAQNASLQDILKAMADAGHFSLYLEASLADPITVHFEQQSFLNVLEALLQGQSSLIRYARDQGQIRIEDVQVLAPSPPPTGVKEVVMSPPAASGRPAPGGETPAIEAGRQEEKRESGEPIEAALALAESAQPEAARSTLVDLLQTSEDPDVRQQALAVLAGLEADPLEPLAKAAREDEDGSVRMTALAILGEKARDEPAALGVLQEIAERGIAKQDREDEVDTRLVAAALLEGLREGNP